MKILFVISSLSSGGAERTLSLIANKLAENGYEIHILTLCKSELFYEIANNIKLINLDLCGISTNFFQTLLRTVKMVKSIRSTIKKISPNVSVGFMDTTNILLLLAGAGQKSKILITEHLDNKFTNVSSKQKILQRFLYPFATALISVSKGIDENFSFLPLSSRNIINNPVEKDILAKSDKNIDNINLEKYGKFIIAVGRLERQKRFDTLIASFLPLKDKGISLLIFGDGALKNELQLLINHLSLNNTVFLMGRVKNPYYFMKRAQFLVMSSEFEGFGNVLIEAMACGCPCISFDCPSGPGEIITNGINGFLVENQDKEELTKAMQKLIENPQLREDLAKASQKVQKQYALEKIIGQWETVLHRVIA